MADNTENEKKKTPFEMIFELMQWLVLGGLYLKKPGQGGPDLPGGGNGDKNEMPDWLLSVLAPFSDEDEIIYAQLLDTIGDDDQKKVDKFRLKLVTNGWDEDIFRLRLVKNFKDSIGKKSLIKNSATRTLMQIAQADGKYKEQERLGLSKKILVRVSGRKKFFRWVASNKLETLLGIILLPIGLIQLIFWILN